jgi:sec-independent protein translocase protein TatA
MMFPKFGPLELILILVIVTMLFGVGKLPEVFGSVGKGIREFRRNASDPSETEESVAAPVAPAAPVEPAAPVAQTHNGVPVNETTHSQQQ